MGGPHMRTKKVQSITIDTTLFYAASVSICTHLIYSSLASELHRLASSRLNGWRFNKQYKLLDAHLQRTTCAGSSPVIIDIERRLGVFRGRHTGQTFLKAVYIASQRCQVQHFDCGNALGREGPLRGNVVPTYP